MIVSSHPSVNLFLTSGQQTPARPSSAHLNQEVSPPEATTNISAAGQLRAALDRLQAAGVGLGTTDAFSPKPVSTESSARQDQDKESDTQRRANTGEQLPAFNPAPPVAPNPLPNPAAGNKEPDIRVSLAKSASDSVQQGLRLHEDRKTAARITGEDDAGAATVPTREPPPAGKTVSLAASAAAPEHAAPSLAAAASSKEPVARTAEPTPVVAPLSAPLPARVPVSSAVRELTTAANELRAVVARTDKPSETDTRTRELRDQAVRTLDAIERKAAPLQAVGIQRDAQGALQVNEPALQAALTRAPQQVQQVLSDTRQAISAQLAPPPPAAVPDNTDNIRRAAQEVPAPRRSEAPARLAPPEPAQLVEQVSQLGQTLNSIVATGVQLQHELVRQDDQSSAQSSLQNRLNTLAHSMTP